MAHDTTYFGDEDGIRVVAAIEMATGAVFGKVEEFNSGTEDWPNYVERLNHFFKANSITTDEQKQAVFLSVIGATTYKLLRNLVSPEKPGEKSFTELVKLLSDHFNPTPSEIVQRFKFHGRFRKEGESVATYVAELRSLAEHCNYEATLESMLRDQLVWGIKDASIQKRLLAEQKLTYTKAIELALGLEAAAQNVQTLKDPSREAVRPPENRGVNTITPVSKSLTCHRCGKAGHIAPKCRFKDTVCHQCGKKGHLKAVCRSKPRGNVSRRRGNARNVRHVQEDDDSTEEELPLHCIGTRKDSVQPLKIRVTVDDRSMDMEVDTGAAVTLMSEATFRKHWPNRRLSAASCKLCSYSKEPIPVAGTVQVQVAYKSQTFMLPLIIVKGDGPTLFGRNWLAKIVLDWKEIHLVKNPLPLQALLQKYEAVFQEGLGTLQGFKAKLIVDPAATPRFCKARPVPYSMRKKVEDELERLTKEGILEPVEFSPWAAPIVAVMKADKTNVRICGDFRQTVNSAAKLDKYPIPKVEDLFATLSGGKTFTKLDLSQAYQQLPLDEESKPYVVINTLKGLFRYTRLPYGVSSAPGIFQRVMESLLQGISGVVVYIDDILITGATEEEHLQALEEVLSRLQKSGLRAKKAKCKFMAPSVNYLGHRIDAEGLHPLPDKVKAVNEAPSPTCVTELKAYLGLLTYYGKFLPNLSSTLAPLYALLQKDYPWRWSGKEEKAFQASKQLLTSSHLLVHFDPKLKLTLACDASAYGIGVVLAHCMPDGSEKPIGYASRSLSKAERNYSQLEKEGLACVFGVKKFHSYIFGHPFELVTDHKPLLTLLSEHKATSPQASARIRRWSLTLSTYEYTIVFRKTEDHGNADALSRLPLNVVPAQSDTPPEVVLLMETLEELPTTANHISSWTRRDPVLSSVVQYLQKGWPSQSDPNLNPYYSRKSELSLHSGCILWGSRVVVPDAGRKAVLQELHSGHQGMSRMKSLARMYVWWPGMDADIEKLVRTCAECQSIQSTPPVAPLHPWKWPTRPWARLHLDFAGPFLEKNFLIVIDAHSKWIEAFPTSTTSSAAVIEELRPLFARFGLPETVVTDNGSGFVSQEFEEFLRKNGIKHITSASYHPATNGLAERAVQILKRGLKKVKSGSLQSRIAKVLFAYRLTPQGTTGVSPAELLMGRIPRSRLELLKPNLTARVEDKQQQQKSVHDQKAKLRVFKTGDQVHVKNHRPGPQWLPGKILETTGPLSFRVQLEDNRVVRCHQDHLRPRETQETSVQESSQILEDAPIPLETSSSEESVSPSPAATTPEGSQSSTFANSRLQSESLSESTTTTRVYPKRAHVPPQRYEPEL